MITTHLPALFQALSLRNQLLWVVGSSLVVVLGCYYLLLPRAADPLEEYGGLLAEQVANLAVEALVKQDTIYLNVLAERVANSAAVASVTIVSVDGQELAAYGDRQAARVHTHTSQIKLEDAVAGHARVTVNIPPAASPLPAILPGAIAALFCTLLIVWLSRNLARDTAVPAQPTYRKLASSAEEPAERTAETQRTEVAPERVATTAPGGLLLVVNLLGTLNTADSTATDACMDHADAVARLYDALCEPLAGGGCALLFQPANPAVRFQAACAALLIGQLTASDSACTSTRVRFSLQDVPLCDGSGDVSVSQFLGSDTLADAVLLAAVADDGTLAMPPEFIATMEGPERLVLRAEENSALRSLRHADSHSYYLSRGAEPRIDEFLQRQASALLG